MAAVRTQAKPSRAVQEGKAAATACVAESQAGLISPTLQHEEIARLAYLYWEARGGVEGSAEEDWFRAEQELKAREAAAAA